MMKKQKISLCLKLFTFRLLMLVGSRGYYENASTSKLYTILKDRRRPASLRHGSPSHWHDNRNKYGLQQQLRSLLLLQQIGGEHKFSFCMRKSSPYTQLSVSSSAQHNLPSIIVESDCMVGIKEINKTGTSYSDTVPMVPSSTTENAYLLPLMLVS